MNCSICRASLQLRVCIAICVFIVIASIPLQMIDIKPGKYLIINLPEIKDGGPEYALYYHYNSSLKRLELRYQNRFRIPDDTINHCVLSFMDEDGRQKAIKQDHVSFYISEKKDSVLIICIDLSTSPLPQVRKSKSPNTAGQNKQTESPELKVNDGTPGELEQTRKIEPQVKARDLFNYHSVTIDIFQASGAHRARIQGLLSRPERHVKNVTIEHPFKYDKRLD